MAGTISATIEHKFMVSQFENTDEDGALCSPDLEVVHNDVTLKFRLQLYPKDPSEENKDHIGLYLFYEDGPQAKIKVDYEYFVVNNSKKRISLWSTEDQEFEAGRDGWGRDHGLSRSVNELKADGYLSSSGTILHVCADLTIQESAFVRQIQIFASITHKFDVQEMLNTDPGGYINSSVVSVAHNNVKLDFKLCANPNDNDRSTTGESRIGLFVEYLKGPNKDLVMDVELIVVKARKRHSIDVIRSHKYTVDTGGYGSYQLPRSPEALTAAGYVTCDNKLHVIAELGIPESAFAVPEAKPALIQVDTVGFRLFQEIATPANTTSPVSNRVELVSRDGGTHLWAHKDVLSCASPDVFKDLFDPDRPEETKMDCFKQGVLTFDDLSGEALRQMLHFVYMQQTGKEFEQFALEIVPVADRFLIKGLKEACEQQLVQGMDLMSIGSLCSCLADSYTYNLPALTAACTKTLLMILRHDNDDDIDQENLVALINLCQQHSLTPLKTACEEKLAAILDNTNDRGQFLSLLSLARGNQLEVLVTHCVRWFRNKFDVLKADGFITELMNGSIENGLDVVVFLVESLVTLPLS